MSDPLADLKRRAYARSDDDGDALQAQAELARLEHEQQLAGQDVPLDLPRAPRHAVANSHTQVLLGLGILLAAAVAVITLPPTRSVAVFDRPQEPRDVPAVDFGLWVEPAAADSVRRLEAPGSADVFVYRTATGSVCLSVFGDDLSASTCTSSEHFLQGGLALQFVRGPADSTYLTVLWGPHGDPRFYDVPLDEIAH